MSHVREDRNVVNEPVTVRGSIRRNAVAQDPSTIPALVVEEGLPIELADQEAKNVEKLENIIKNANNISASNPIPLEIEQIKSKKKCSNKAKKCTNAAITGIRKHPRVALTVVCATVVTPIIFGMSEVVRAIGLKSPGADCYTMNSDDLINLLSSINTLLVCNPQDMWRVNNVYGYDTNSACAKLQELNFLHTIHKDREGCNDGYGYGPTERWDIGSGGATPAEIQALQDSQIRFRSYSINYLNKLNIGCTLGIGDSLVKQCQSGGNQALSRFVQTLCYNFNRCSRRALTFKEMQETVADELDRLPEDQRQDIIKDTINAVTAISQQEGIKSFLTQETKELDKLKHELVMNKTIDLKPIKEEAEENLNTSSANKSNCNIF